MNGKSCPQYLLGSQQITKADRWPYEWQIMSTVLTGQPADHESRLVAYEWQILSTVLTGQPADHESRLVALWMANPVHSTYWAASRSRKPTGGLWMANPVHSTYWAASRSRKPTGGLMNSKSCPQYLLGSQQITKADWWPYEWQIMSTVLTGQPADHESRLVALWMANHVHSTYWAASRSRKPTGGLMNGKSCPQYLLGSQQITKADWWPYEWQIMSTVLTGQPADHESRLVALWIANPVHSTYWAASRSRKPTGGLMNDKSCPQYLLGSQQITKADWWPYEWQIMSTVLTGQPADHESRLVALWMANHVHSTYWAASRSRKPTGGLMNGKSCPQYLLGSQQITKADWWPYEWQIMSTVLTGQPADHESRLVALWMANHVHSTYWAASRSRKPTGGLMNGKSCPQYLLGSQQMRKADWYWMARLVSDFSSRCWWTLSRPVVKCYTSIRSLICCTALYLMSDI